MRTQPNPKPARPRLMPGLLAERVEHSLAVSPLDTVRIQVRVFGGDLIFAGRTSSRDELLAILDRCARIENVARVINRAVLTD